MPRDPALLDKAFEVIFALHVNEEPTIRVSEEWGSRSKLLDDEDNPTATGTGPTPIRCTASRSADAIRETDANIIRDGFDTRPIEMQPMWLVMFQAPTEDVDRIFEAVCEVVPLKHGNTDRNGYRAPGGVEYYRPREGTPTGAEEDTRQRPDVEEMRFFLPRDTAMLDAVVRAVYEVHSYYEPVITASEVLRSQCKGLDDSRNPHRW